MALQSIRLNMQHYHHSLILPSLLSMLKYKKVCHAQKVRKAFCLFNHNFAEPELLRLLSGYIPAQTHMSDVYAFGCLYYEVCHNNCTRALLLNCLLDPLWQ